MAKKTADKALLGPPARPNSHSQYVGAVPPPVVSGTPTGRLVSRGVGKVAAEQTKGVAKGHFEPLGSAGSRIVPNLHAQSLPEAAATQANGRILRPSTQRSGRPAFNDGAAWSSR